MLERVTPGTAGFQARASRPGRASQSRPGTPCAGGARESRNLPGGQSTLLAWLSAGLGRSLVASESIEVHTSIEVHKTGG